MQLGPAWEQGLGKACWHLSFSPCGAYLAVLHKATLAVCDVNAACSLCAEIGHSFDYNAHMAWSPDGRKLVTLQGRTRYQICVVNVNIWDVASSFAVCTNNPISGGFGRLGPCVGLQCAFDHILPSCNMLSCPGPCEISVHHSQPGSVGSKVCDILQAWFSPAISPDGCFAAILTGHQSRVVLWVISCSSGKRVYNCSSHAWKFPSGINSTLDVSTGAHVTLG